LWVKIKQQRKPHKKEVGDGDGDGEADKEPQNKKK
jgi:hypothetical protein